MLQQMQVLLQVVAEGLLPGVLVGSRVQGIVEIVGAVAVGVVVQKKLWLLTHLYNVTSTEGSAGGLCHMLRILTAFPLLAFFITSGVPKQFTDLITINQ